LEALIKGMKEICYNRNGFISILLFAVALSFSSCCTCQNSPSVKWKGKVVQPQKEYEPDELLIKFKSGVQDKEIKDFFDLYRFSMIQKIEDQEIFHVKIPENTSIWEMVEALSQDSRIQYIEPNYMRSIH
jgi:hypothetical protein